MNTFELIIFIFFISTNTFILLTWLYKKWGYKSGEFYDSGEVVTLYVLPRVVLVQYIILLIFFFAEFNKLHLLYIYPLVYILINLTMVKKVIKEDEKRNK